jgi:EF hand domain-containing protein
MTKIARLTFIAALAFPAFAMGQSVSDLDMNGDGVLTIDEIQAAFPEVTSDAFMAMDLNADGALDSDEATAAMEAGLIPAKDG